MKLELKHLAPYLPYELSILPNNYKTCGSGYGFYYKVLDIGCLSDLENRLEDIKPILKPVEDLIGEIGLPSAIEDYLRGKGVKRIVDLPYWAITYLLGENQEGYNFDVFGLIEKGLAVDINTI